MKAEDILESALELIAERGKDYGNIEDTFKRTAEIATAILGKEFTPYEIAVIMHSVKLARLKTSPTKIDSYVDGINYLAFAGGFVTNGNPLPVNAGTTGKDLQEDF